MSKRTVAPKTYLGLDPGRESGWSILDDHGDLQHYGVATNAYERAQVVALAVGNDQVGRPVKVIMEDVGKFGNRPTVFGLGRSVGTWLQALEERAISGRSIEYVSIPHWRKLVLGKSRADKQDAQAWVTHMYGLVDVNHNAAEAICIAFSGYIKYNKKEISNVKKK